MSAIAKFRIRMFIGFIFLVLTIMATEIVLSIRPKTNIIAKHPAKPCTYDELKSSNSFTVELPELDDFIVLFIFFS